MPHARPRTHALFCCALVLLLCTVSGCATTRHHGSDEAWYDQQGLGESVRPAIYDGVVRTSRYVRMRDGVELAIDLYLPEGLPQATRVPTLLMQTRYIRSLEYRWPFSAFLDSRFRPMIDFFVQRGYAWVYADARGSGASFGTRPYPYAEDEIRDGAELVEWIVHQPWSDGKVGSIGSSYTGQSALFLLSNQHPAVRSIMPRYAYFDAYPEVIYPGGIHLRWMSETWGALGKALDRNRLPEFLGRGTWLAVKGARPVDADTDRSSLQAAVREHADNGDISELTLEIEYSDDVSPSVGVPVERISPYSRLEEIQETGAPVYCYTGWFDASFVLAEINLFNSLETPDKKLTIGPWEHGGWHNISPYAADGRPVFDHAAEAFRFFDATLNGTETGIRREKPVAYYTMGAEQWRFSDTWPPPGAQETVFFLAPDHRLTREAPGEGEAADTYRMDYTTGTGSHTRWESLINVFHDPIVYPDRREEDRKLLCYTTAPLERDTEVTGHPVVTLYVSSSAEDGSFFVYLEDVGPDGAVTYITEGMLRAIHRKLADEDPPYSTVTPYRTFRREDAQPLVPGETAELVFDLYPTSYVFKKGHAIRVAIAGADRDHFTPVPETPPTVRFHRSRAHPSHITLPVMPR